MEAGVFAQGQRRENVCTLGSENRLIDEAGATLEVSYLGPPEKNCLF